MSWGRAMVNARGSADELMADDEAAALLHVTRAYLDTLIAEERLGEVSHAPDGERRVRRAAVLAYRNVMKAEQKEGLGRMIEASERMGLYDAEADGLSVRKAESTPKPGER